MRIEDNWLDVQVCLVSFKAHITGGEPLVEQLIIAPSSLKEPELKKRVEQNFKNYWLKHKNRREIWIHLQNLLQKLSNQSSELE
ncbi:hypothetical protein [Carnobacterium maltaromaticum]|uniref:hypothetical protein n=1 Tax=Carnobacterium maltaromaticum TaxID=2751 RepID=UPI0039BDE925